MKKIILFAAILAFFCGGFSLANAWTSSNAVIVDSGNSDWAVTSVIDNSGNLFVASYYGTSGTERWRIEKYKPNGTLDTMWGTNGVVYQDAGWGHYPYDMYIDSSGYLYIAGEGIGPVNYNGTATGDEGPLVIKLNPQGQIDTSWGNNGTVQYDAETGYRISFDSSGNLFFSGQRCCSPPPYIPYDWFLLKFTSSGQPDNSWGSNGAMIIDHGGNNDYGGKHVLDSNGNIFIFGSFPSGTNVIRKYTSAGLLDPTWGTNGTLTVTGISSFNDINIDSSGRIYAVGTANTNGNDWTIKRYNSTGQLDTGWGGTGTVTFNSGGSNNDRANRSIVDSSGNIFVVGSIGTNSGDLAVRKYLPGGQPDTTWATNGMNTYSGGGNESGADVSIDEVTGTVYAVGQQLISGGTWNILIVGFPKGDIVVDATLDGNPWTGPVNYTISGPETINGSSVNATHSNVQAGENYTMSDVVSGGPSGAILDSVTPLTSQTLPDGLAITFTLNFVTSSPSGPVAWWKFDETSGAASASDSSGNGNTGTLENMDPNTDWVVGKINNALDFDGADDYISVSHNDILNVTNNISISAWVKMDSLGVSNQQNRIVQKGGQTYVSSLYSLDIDDRTANFVLHGSQPPADDLNCTGLKCVRSSQFLSTGVWYHIVGTYDGSVMRMYVNGVLDGSNNIGPSTGLPNGGQIKIGIGDPATQSDRFDGCIDDLRIYNRVLSPAEILNLSNVSGGGNCEPAPDPEDFALYSLNSNSLYTTISGSGAVSNTALITVTPFNNFDDDVSLSVAGISPMIAGLGSSFSPDNILIESEYDIGSDLTLTLPAGTEPGPYIVDVQGDAIGLPPRHLYITLTVQVRDPDFREVMRDIFQNLAGLFSIF